MRTEVGSSSFLYNKWRGVFDWEGRRYIKVKRPTIELITPRDLILKHVCSSGIYSCIEHRFVNILYCSIPARSTFYVFYKLFKIKYIKRFLFCTIKLWRRNGLEICCKITSLNIHQTFQIFRAILKYQGGGVATVRPQSLLNHRSVL